MIHLTVFLPTGSIKDFQVNENGVVDIKYKKSKVTIIYNNGNTICYSGIPFIIQETL